MVILKNKYLPPFRSLLVLLVVAVAFIVPIGLFIELTELILWSLHLLSCVATKGSVQ